MNRTIRTPRRRPELPPLASALAAAVLALASSCSDSNNSTPPGPPPTTGGSLDLAGTVVDAAGTPVVGASVYLVPASSVPTTEITAAAVLDRTAEAYDEPLEDPIRTNGTTFQRDTTDASGRFVIANVADGDYFVFAMPDAADTGHLPGGNWCREARSAATLRGQDITIKVSSRPSATATYQGMSVCLTCHDTYDGEKKLAHRLGFRVPGQSSLLQSTAMHPEIDDGLAYFTEGTAYTDGTPVWLYDYDPSRGFDKFKTSLSDPSGSGGVVYAKLWLWKDSGTGEYKITFENVGNPGDPNNLAERVVKLTYGGAVYKQRYMIEWPGRNGLYPVLQYQHEGDDARYDRTRRVFRDYHLNFYWNDGGTPSDPADDLIQAPDITKNIQRNCLGCHATGYTQYTDATTNEILCDAVEDPNGEYDIDGDGFINDLNTGCETCHGPGSEHVVANAASAIVSPELLSPSREVQLCGRCHDRQEGADAIGNEQPLNAAGEFPWAGIGRDEYLTNYVSQPGPAQGSFWPDFKHSKSHHQQVPDMLKSKHYRNDEELLTCTTCHDVHGFSDHEHGLVADPDAPDSPLCMNCHADKIASTSEHTLEMLGVPHGAATATCVSCHMVKTAKTGAGRYGFLLGQPTGASTDADITYFENDITSHIFDVPRKNNVGVAGVQPQSAMPIPYTRSCGTCHDPTALPWL